jgi:CheY-like chemotaxis protein
MTTNQDRKTVLVVDDTPDNLSLLSGLLREEYRVKLANSGDKALKAVQGDSPPNLILLDIMMPGIFGYEVCAALNADARTRAIPVIFRTAMSAPEDEQKGLELGAVDYVTKPISPSLFLVRMRNHLAMGIGMARGLATIGAIGPVALKDFGQPVPVAEAEGPAD